MAIPFAILLAMLTAQPPPEPSPESRRIVAERPRLLWEEGPAVSWQVPAEPPRSVALALDAPLFAAEASPGALLQAELGPGSRIVLASGGAELLVLEGPRGYRFTLLDDTGGVAVTRAPALEVPATPGTHEVPDPVIVALPESWATGPFASMRASSPAPTPDAAGLAIRWPAGRAIAPTDVASPPRIRWYDPDATAASRYDLEISIIDGGGVTLGGIERWWRVAGPSFGLAEPWPAGARISVQLARVGEEPLQATVDVLDGADIDSLTRLRAGLRARAGLLGAPLAAALDAMALEQFGLDKVARGVWWHVGVAMAGQPRGDELAARGGTSPF